MTIKEAQAYAKGIDLTDADKRSFEDFQPLAEQFKPFLDSGDTVLMINSERRTIVEREVTQLTLEPQNSDNKAVKLVLAFNNRNIYVGGKSLKEIGEKDIDAAMTAVGAFKVESIDLTGEYPMRRSVAAETEELLPTKVFTDADWSKLRKTYNSSPEMRKAAVNETYDAAPRYEIPHIEISPVE